MKSILKYPGGKSWLATRSKKLISELEPRFVAEPFCGGLSFSLNNEFERVLANDLISPLINLYQHAQKGFVPNKDDWHLDKAFYLDIRERFNQLIANNQVDSEFAAGAMWYLSYHCFNGLMRFNLKGGFNVPFGQYDELATPSGFTQFQDVTKDWTFINGFRFLTQQALTSELDLRVFDKPVRPTKVDALSLGAEDVHSLTTTLLSGGGSPLQRLFSSVATLLGYYGGLRRGEVLRLRMKDIRCTTRKGAHFDVRITRTSEGGPKGGKPRWVYMVLPEAAAKLIRLVMSLKQTCQPKTPFLGFIGESKSSRERHYLKPISKALKARFGKRARFHHLRHAGATLLYRQGLHLACGRFSEASMKGVEQSITSHLLAESMVNARFQYWLQGREFGHVNNALLFDEIGRQLGHQYYATTRLHYLHGMEWVTPFFVPQERCYSRAELRYILGLSTHSNDVSRILSSLVPEYATLSVPEKKSYHPILTHEQLNGLLMGRLNVRRVSMPHPNTDTQFNDNNWITLWNNTTEQQALRCANPQHTEFMWQTQACLHMLHTGQQTFAAISKVWQTFGQHKPFHIEKTALSALKTLGPLMLTQTHNFIFEGPCNQKTQKALNALRSIGINAQLHMTLHQNRKRLDSKKWAFIQHQLLKPGDTAEKRIHNTGKTYLTLTLSVPNLPLAARHEFRQWWIRHTQPNL